MTPREITLILRGSAAKMQAENELARQRNYELAQLIAYAHHDPSKMPEYNDGSKKPEVPDDVAQMKVRAYFMAMAQRSGG